MPDDCPQDSTRRTCEICKRRDHSATMCPSKCICGVGDIHNINGCPNICDCGQGRPHMPDDCPQDRTRRTCEICNTRDHNATMCPHKCNCNIGNLHHVNNCPNLCGCGERPTHLTVDCPLIKHLTLLSEVPMFATSIVLALLNVWCYTSFSFLWTEIPSNTRK